MASPTIFRQLYLFDCDGGVSSLFNDKSKLAHLPNNCELYLFWNAYDPNINKNLEQLLPNPQVHLCRVHLINTKNSADAKLIYFLGKLVNEFSKIVVVQGNDEIYREVVETVRHEFSNEKIGLHKVKEHKPTELESLIKEMQACNLQNNYIEAEYELLGGSLKAKLFVMTIHESNTCPACDKTFTTLSGVVSHVTAKHQLDGGKITTIKVDGGITKTMPIATKQSNTETTTTASRCPHPACALKKKVFAKANHLQQHTKSMHEKKN